MWILFIVGLFLGPLAVVESRYPDIHSPDAVKEFNHWKLQYGKRYANEQEHWERYYTFLENLKIINALNAKPKMTRSDPAHFGLNQFADMSTKEFQQKILQPPKRAIHHPDKIHRSNRTRRAPTSYDWSAENGVVNSVKDQGQAGACWAFAGCANVESLWAIKTGEASPDLSTEAPNDCDGIADIATAALACGPLGATMPGFYEWVIKEGGFMTWEDYPYCVGDGSCFPCAPSGYSKELCGGSWPIKPCNEEDSCAAKYDTSKFVPGLKVKDYTFFSSNEETLRDDLVNTGPLVAGIDATDLQFYQSGVLEPLLCNDVMLNHAVLLTGYDQTEDGVDYWMFKNSWSTGWGEKGFGRIIRGEDACGINTDVSSVVLG